MKKDNNPQFLWILDRKNVIIAGLSGCFFVLFFQNYITLTTSKYYEHVLLDVIPRVLNRCEEFHAENLEDLDSIKFTLEDLTINNIK